MINNVFWKLWVVLKLSLSYKFIFSTFSVIAEIPQPLHWILKSAVFEFDVLQGNRPGATEKKQDQRNLDRYTGTDLKATT
jgi:hypothetical protein